MRARHRGPDGVLQVALEFGHSTRAIGRIAWDGARGAAVLEWDAEFVARPLPISPYVIGVLGAVHIASAQRMNGLPGFLADHLPGGWARAALLHTASGAVTPLDVLARVGPHGLGALRVYGPRGQGDVLANVQPDLRPDLRHGRIDGHAVFVRQPAGAPASFAQEAHAYALMARAAGIEVAPTHVITMPDGQSALATARFDRTRSEGGVEGRLHLHSAAGLLEVGDRHALSDYDTLIRLVRYVTRDARAVAQMVRRVIFNVAAGHRGAHLKKHAFVMDGAGRWRLSPAYDVTLSEGRGGAHYLSVAGEAHAPSLDHLRALAVEAGIKPRVLAQMFEDIRGAIAHWPQFGDQAQLPRRRRVSIAAQLVEMSPFRG